MDLPPRARQLSANSSSSHYADNPKVTTTSSITRPEIIKCWHHFWHQAYQSAYFLHHRDRALGEELISSYYWPSLIRCNGHHSGNAWDFHGLREAVLSVILLFTLLNHRPLSTAAIKSPRR